MMCNPNQISQAPEKSGPKPIGFESGSCWLETLGPLRHDLEVACAKLARELLCAKEAWLHAQLQRFGLPEWVDEAIQDKDSRYPDAVWYVLNVFVPRHNLRLVESDGGRTVTLEQHGTPVARMQFFRPASSDEIGVSSDGVT